MRGQRSACFAVGNENLNQWVFFLLENVLQAYLAAIVGRTCWIIELATQRIPRLIFNPRKSLWHRDTKEVVPAQCECKLTLVLTGWGRISQAKAIKIRQNDQGTYCMFGPSGSPIKNAFVAMGVHLCMVTGCCSSTYICIPTVAESLYGCTYILHLFLLLI